MRKDAYEPEPSEWMAILRPLTSERRRERHVFSPRHSALLLTDMQHYFLDESSRAYVPAAVRIIQNLQRLMEAFRARSLPVIFTRHALLRGEDAGAMARWWGDMLYDDDPMSMVVPQLKPLQGERVVRKTQYSAFMGTDLDEVLRGLDVKQVLMTGVMTHLCCESTARDAFMRGYDVFFVIDGTATKSEDLHLSSLKTITEGVAMPVTTEEVLNWLRERM